MQKNMEQIVQQDDTDLEIQPLSADETNAVSGGVGGSRFAGASIRTSQQSAGRTAFGR